jgi:AcrR family transcriptional regulator
VTAARSPEGPGPATAPARTPGRPRSAAGPARPDGPARADRPARPGRPRSAEAEQAIRAAAVALLTERGIGGFSVEAVAARAGVAKTTIYRRWPTRDDLIVAAVSGLKGPATGTPGESVRGDLVHVLRRAARRDSSGAWAGLMARLMLDAEQQPELVGAIWRDSVGPHRDHIRSILARGVAEGLVRPDADLGLLVDMLTAPAVTRRRPGREPLSDPEIDAVVDIVLRGVAP